MEKAIDIVIVGAGPAGLAVAASLARHGLRPRIFERGGSPAWSWVGHYPTLRLHTSRAISQLPGLTLQSATSYPDREELLRYCANYARELALDVAPDHDVMALRRDGERWCVETSQGDYFAQHVVVATGFFSGPRVPEWPGREQFQGVWLSPGDLGAENDLNGRKALVVGLGNTGADMIAELARRGARVTVSVRGPVHAVPLEIVGVNVFRWAQWLPELSVAAARRVGEGVAARVARLSAIVWATVQERGFGDLRAYGLELASSEEILADQKNGHPPVVGGAWTRLLREGSLSVRAEIARITPEAVEFIDGTRESFDAILPSIGLEESRFRIAGESSSPLRDGAVPDKPNLWLCGTAPALRHIRRSAPRIAAQIAAAMRQSDGE
ncbi:MAG: NAD(P)/FAD-dependent oxidoreductase [Acidobacteria bacterium]|nr:NAD(P)/FAD-dependent oxidoreductase [Acidobacteriota bacterium]